MALINNQEIVCLPVCVCLCEVVYKHHSRKSVAHSPACETTVFCFSQVQIY